MLTQEDIEKLEAQHGMIAHCKGKVVEDRNGKKYNEWEVVLKKAPRKVYKVFRSMANNPTQAADAQEFAMRNMIVYPSVENLDALLEQYPGIPESKSVVAAIKTMFGIESDETGKV